MDMFGLYKVQILLVGLLFVPVLTCSCVDEDKLEKKAKKMLKRYPQALEPAAVAESGTPECPIKLYEQLNEDISNRSISPWRYILETKEDRFPRTLAVAQCLCEGCIMTNRERGRHESRDYNSKPVIQSRVVLIKKPCKNAKKYRLVPENELVAVGCTCVKTRTV